MLYNQEIQENISSESAFKIKRMYTSKTHGIIKRTPESAPNFESQFSQDTLMNCINGCL